MTQNEIFTAIQAVIARCKKGLETGYPTVSMRGMLYDCGYSVHETDFVLQFVSSEGFNYCLDSRIAHEKCGDDSRQEFPPYEACYWGADQLISRLNCVLPMNWQLH